MPTSERHWKTAGDGNWEPIYAPFDCSYYSIAGPIANLQQVFFDKCSDPEDDTSCVPGLTQFSVTAPPLMLSGVDPPSHRWKKGEVITYVKSSSPLSVYVLR